MRLGTEKIIVIVMSATLVAAMALAIIALGLTRSEKETYANELKLILSKESVTTAEKCSSYLATLNRTLVAKIERTPATPATLKKLIDSEPFFVNFFIAKRDGTLIYPAQNSQWGYRFQGVFAFSNTTMNESNAEGKTKKIEFKSNFERLLNNQDSGFIPWLSDNRYTPLIWSRSPDTRDIIVGFEVESIVLWSRIISQLPTTLPDYFRLEMVDANNKIIHAVGGELEQNKELSLVYIAEISDSILPNTTIKAYLIQEKIPSSNLYLVVIFAILSLILVIILAGVVAIYLTRRALNVAQKKSNFVSQVSHELKTPLTSIRMYSELLSTNEDKLSENKKSHYLKIINDEAERLTRLVNNVLDFSRLESGKKRYNSEIVNLTELLNFVKENYNEQLKNEAKELTLTIENSSTPLVKIDRDSLLQVLYNIIDNSIKYAPSSPKIEIGLSKKLTTWEIKIRDYGAGISAKNIKKIFKKFYRIDNDLASNSSGFGLGLTISKQLMEDQNYELQAISSRDGAIFIIKIGEAS